MVAWEISPSEITTEEFEVSLDVPMPVQDCVPSSDTSVEQEIHP